MDFFGIRDRNGYAGIPRGIEGRNSRDEIESLIRRVIADFPDRCSRCDKLARILVRRATLPAIVSRKPAAPVEETTRFEHKRYQERPKKPARELTRRTTEKTIAPLNAADIDKLHLYTVDDNAYTLKIARITYAMQYTHWTLRSTRNIVTRVAT